jgi:hypothetical protein
MDPPKVLFLVADCPGYFLDSVSSMAGELTRQGIGCLFAVTSPYYERFRKVQLSAHGHVTYFSDFEQVISPDSDEVGLDYWLTYPTFVRQLYFYGKHLNKWETYRRVAAFYRRIFDSDRSIEVVCSEPPSNSFLCLGYAEARRRDIPFFGYMPARVPGYFNVFLDLYGEELLCNAVSEHRAFGAIDTAPEYTQNVQNTLSEQSLLRLFEGLSEKLERGARAFGPSSLETGSTFFYQMRAYRSMLFRKLRYRASTLFARPFDDEVDWTRRGINVFFPLQFRPEASTSVLARHYGDDEEVIRNIAFSLPDGARLYVKEHPAAIGIRPSGFYRRIRAFPGVHLLGPDYPLKSSLERFDCVVTLTSTVGFEALQRGVPVFVLGRVFYAGYPGAVRVESFQSLSSRLCSLPRRLSAHEREAVIRRYQERCFPGSFNYMSPQVVDRDNIALLVRPMLDWVRSRGTECRA